MKIKALAFASLVVAAVSSQAAFTYSTGFESSEGFTVGAIDGQNGYTTFTAAAAVPVISTANAASGSQHLRLPQGGSTTGTLSGAFSSVFTPGANDVYTLSLDIAISGDLGANYSVVAQDTVASLLNFRVEFDWQGNIFVVDDLGLGAEYVDTGVSWTVGGYNNLTVVQDIANNTISYSYNGSSIYSGANWNGNTSLNQIVMFSDSWQNPGEFGDIDNVSLVGTDAVPEPATMMILGLAATAVAARKRRK